jgi:histidinol-phosphate aminotransferase
MTTMRFKKFNIEAYKPGKSSVQKLKKIIKLSANESALGVSPKVKKIISNKKINFFRYPDGNSKKLKNCLSKKFKCDENKIICGAGSDEVIQMICQLFLKPNDEVIVPQFSFLMYRIYSKIVGAKVIFAPENNLKISIINILKNVTKKTKIVFLANPNNPTGTYLNKFELILLRKKLRKNILLVIDDAYNEYMKNSDYKSGLDLFKNKPNVFILRTFSKIYGLAALRIGWGYGPKKIIDALQLIKPPFNVNEVAQLAAIVSLKDKNFISRSVKHNIIYATKIKNFLNKYNINSSEITANFLLLDFSRCKLKAKYFFKKLK